MLAQCNVTTNLIGVDVDCSLDMFTFLGKEERFRLEVRQSLLAEHDEPLALVDDRSDSRESEKLIRNGNCSGNRIYGSIPCAVQELLRALNG